MGKINWNRVILGGLVAGAIISIFEFVLNGVVLAKDMKATNLFLSFDRSSKPLADLRSTFSG